MWLDGLNAIYSNINVSCDYCYALCCPMCGQVSYRDVEYFVDMEIGFLQFLFLTLEASIGTGGRAQSPQTALGRKPVKFVRVSQWYENVDVGE